MIKKSDALKQDILDLEIHDCTAFLKNCSARKCVIFAIADTFDCKYSITKKLMLRSMISFQNCNFNVDKKKFNFKN